MRGSLSCCLSRSSCLWWSCKFEPIIFNKPFLSAFFFSNVVFFYLLTYIFWWIFSLLFILLFLSKDIDSNRHVILYCCELIIMDCCVASTKWTRSCSVSLRNKTKIAYNQPLSWSSENFSFFFFRNKNRLCFKLFQWRRLQPPKELHPWRVQVSTKFKSQN